MADRHTGSAASLSPEMARRLRRVQERIERATAERDALVLEARETGTLREVGEALGLSHTAVAKIEARQKEADRG